MSGSDTAMSLSDLSLGASDGMSWQEPLWLLLAPVIILVVSLIRWLIMRWSWSQLHHLGIDQSALREDVRWRWRSWRVFGMICGLFCVAIAMAGPRWGQEAAPPTSRGADVVIAFDCSRSMLADDIYPDRLTAAQREISALLSELGGHRVALLPFAGAVLERTPLTSDRRALQEMIQELSPELFPAREKRQGTAIALAVQRGVELLQRAQSSQGVILVVSDGDDTDDSRVIAAKGIAASMNIPVIGVLAGDPEQNPQILFDNRAANVPAKDTTLQNFADATGGSVIRLQPGSEDTTRLMSLISNAGSERVDGEAVRWVTAQRYLWFLLPGMLLLLLSQLAPMKQPHRAATTLLLLLAPIAQNITQTATQLIAAEEAPAQRDPVLAESIAKIVHESHVEVSQWVAGDNPAAWARAHHHLQQWGQLVSAGFIELDVAALMAATRELDTRLGRQATLSAENPNNAPNFPIQQETEGQMVVGTFSRFSLPEAWLFDKDAALPPGLAFDTPPEGAKWSTSVAGTPRLVGRYRLPAVDLTSMTPVDCWIDVTENPEATSATLPLAAHATIGRPWQYRLPILPPTDRLNDVALTDFPQTEIVPPGIIRLTPNRSGRHTVRVPSASGDQDIPVEFHQPTRLYGGNAIVARAGRLFRHPLHTGHRPGSRITRVAGLPAGLWHHYGTIGGGCQEVGSFALQVYGVDHDGFRWQAPAELIVKQTVPQPDEMIEPQDQEDQEQDQQQNGQQDQQQQNQQQQSQDQQQQQDQSGQQQEQQQGQGQQDQQNQDQQSQQQQNQDDQQESSQNNSQQNEQENEPSPTDENSDEESEQSSGSEETDNESEADGTKTQSEDSNEADTSPETTETDPQDGDESEAMENRITDGRQDIDQNTDEESDDAASSNDEGTSTASSDSSSSNAEDGQAASSVSSSDQRDLSEIASDRWLQRLPSGNNPVLLRRLLPIEDAPPARSGDDKGQSW